MRLRPKFDFLERINLAIFYPFDLVDSGVRAVPQLRFDHKIAQQRRLCHILRQLAASSGVCAGIMGLARGG